MSEEKKTRRRIGSIVLVLVGVAIGAGVVSLSRPATPSAPPVASTPEPGVQVWTCSMHPQIRMNKPGKCPICGMDLVLVSTGDGKANRSAQVGNHLTLSEHARRMARVETSTVEPRELWKEIRTVGKVALDETAVAYITARVDGRVDEVYANFPGTGVKEGDHLASIYSPDLLTTQEEFLISARQAADQEKLGRTPSVASGARRRLQLWGITDAQVDALAKSGKAETHLVVYSPRGGTVIEKAIRAGQYVRTGDHLYTVADLSQVWLVAEVYESELSWVRFGQSVSVLLEDDAARSVTGTVGFVEPLLNEPTRTVRVLVVLENESGRLKPGMFAQAMIRIPITPEGTPGPTGLEGKYACRMHPYVVSATAGPCTICGMALDLVPGDAAKAAGTLQVLAVPAEAVLTTGRRTLVYVEQTPGEFHLVEPKLGPRAGDFYPVLDGLAAGDRVVARGTFLLDSQFQISGKPSLLYPEGISGGGAGHSGHSMPDEPAGGRAPTAKPPAPAGAGAPAANPHAGHGGN